jgi:hypothetical protein
MRIYPCACMCFAAIPKLYSSSCANMIVPWVMNMHACMRAENAQGIRKIKQDTRIHAQIAYIKAVSSAHNATKPKKLQHTRAHTYMHTHTHTHMYIYIQMRPPDKRPDLHTYIHIHVHTHRERTVRQSQQPRTSARILRNSARNPVTRTSMSVVPAVCTCVEQNSSQSHMHMCRLYVHVSSKIVVKETLLHKLYVHHHTCVIINYITPYNA